MGFKTRKLINWIIQFGEGVGIFFGHDEEFETVSEAWIFWIFLSQRRYCNRMTINKGWLNQGFFNKFFKESVNNMANLCEVLFERNILFFGQGSGFFKAHILPEIYASNFLDGIYHMNAFKWFINLDFSSLIVDRSISAYRDSRVLNNAFGQVHNILEICISLVNFNRCKLWIMSGIHSFVTEDAANFIDSFHTTYNEALKVQFSRNPQYHINILGIVVGDKWTGSSTACFIVENRSFDFKEALPI